MWLGESPLRGQGSTQLPVEAEWEPVESNFWYHTAVESHGPGYTCPCWCHDSTDDESQRWMQDVSIFCQLSSTFPYGALYFARLRVFSFHALSLFGVKTDLGKYSFSDWTGLDADASCRFISLYPKDHWNKSSVIRQLIGHQLSKTANHAFSFLLYKCPILLQLSIGLICCIVNLIQFALVIYLKNSYGSVKSICHG